jgi:L-ribulose-5-phosphate 3-epimerase
MCLSGHRKYPLGSHDPETRDWALRILRRAIELADTIGIRIVQLMGYDVFYEPSDDQTRAYFIDGVRCGTRWAGQYGVMLALENVDRPLAASVERALELVHAVNSPWFQLYSDMANLQAAGFHPPEQLAMAAGHLVAIHVKDGLPGVIRGVPFEEGDVPFEDTFQALAHIGFWGPMTVEMWSQMDARGDPLASVIAARSLVRRLTEMVWRENNVLPDPRLS